MASDHVSHEQLNFKSCFYVIFLVVLDTKTKLAYLHLMPPYKTVMFKISVVGSNLILGYWKPPSPCARGRYGCLRQYQPQRYHLDKRGSYLRRSHDWRSSDWRIQVLYFFSWNPLTSPVCGNDRPGACSAVASINESPWGGSTFQPLNST